MPIGRVSRGLASAWQAPGGPWGPIIATAGAGTGAGGDSWFFGTMRIVHFFGEMNG